MYCPYCGKYLQDGESCSCEAGRAHEPDQPVQGSSPGGGSDIFSRLMQHPKQVLIGGAALFLAVLVFFMFSGGKNKKLVGHWMVTPGSLDYGFSMMIKDGRIDVRGDERNYSGHMVFKYKVVSDTELALEYDWTFSRWIWDFPRTDTIPLNYSLSEDGETLTLSWAGKDFVWLDNVTAYDGGFSRRTGCIFNGGSVVFTKAQ